METGLFNFGTTPEQKPTSSVTNSLIDFLLQKLNPQMFPTSAKTLIETVQGNKEPITEKNFTPEELTALKNLIETTSNRGDVQYSDYIKFMRKQKEEGTLPASLVPSFLSTLDPIGNLQTTLGRFTYYRDAEGNLIVVDKYNFNKISEQKGIFGALRNYAGEKIPEGAGRDVRINLGNPGLFGNTIESLRRFPNGNR